MNAVSRDLLPEPRDRVHDLNTGTLKYSFHTKPGIELYGEGMPPRTIRMLFGGDGETGNRVLLVESFDLQIEYIS